MVDIERWINELNNNENTTAGRAANKIFYKSLDAKDYFVHNWKDCLTAVPVIVGAVVAVKRGIRSFGPSQYQKERKRIDTTFYDASTRINWRLKRPLTTDQKIELEKRMRNGELVGDILNSMNMLARR